jgi:arylsulfatase A-like enzyme/cytochrome c-type biogenesis protein CcmH/NrfG
MRFRARALCLLVLCAGCSRAPQQQAAAPAAARNLLLITIDTLRADRVGAYGYRSGRTPAIDALAARGVRFESAFSSAPITLTSHATIMTGRYPPGHGARHNGMRVEPGVPTLADTLRQDGFATAAFVAAFPLDRRFGLNKGFDTYSDRMPRGPHGRLSSERPGRTVVDEAIAWLNGHRAGRFFLWVHLFEPHAPYGDPSDRRPVAARYDDEVAEADRQVSRVIEALGADTASTLIAVASDHGEAFGEHGEISHSLFVYDTTLRVPLVIAGPGISPSVVRSTVGLVDLATTLLAQLGRTRFDSDGVDLSGALAGHEPSTRELYAESFAPLLDFGWSPLRTIRSGGLKYIAAPKPELYRLAADAGETQNLIETEKTQAAALGDRVDRISAATLTVTTPQDAESAARLQALGYTSGRATTAGGRADPKDKRALAAEIAQVTSGELQGPALRQALERILAEDPENPQAHVRLGYVLLEARQCKDAERHFTRAIAEHLPGADAHLGLAACQAASRRFDAAGTTLKTAEAAEPDNPVVIANRGIVLSDGGHPIDAVPLLQRALTLDPDFDEARFNLALAHLRAGQKSEAVREAEELLRRLPPDSPQRAEVQRLRDAAR